MIQYKRSDRLMLRPKIYKKNRQTVCIIVKNKNIQALMTKLFIWSFSYSLFWLRNNNIITQKMDYFPGWAYLPSENLGS